MWIFFIVCTLVFIYTVGLDALVFDENDSIESFDEGACVIPPALANLRTNFIKNFAPEGGYYLPFNSKREAVLIAEDILGRNLTSKDDTSKYCPRLDFKVEESGKSFSGHFYGFQGNRSSVTCEKLDDHGDRHECYIENENGFARGLINIYFTLTDEETYYVVLICTNDNKKSWSVVSTESKLDDEVTAQISEHVQTLGFDSNKFNTVDYKYC